MRLENYLLEWGWSGAYSEFEGKHRSKEINKSQFLTYIKSGKFDNMIKYLLKGGVPYMRGYRQTGDFFYVDPYKTKPRKSMFTENYYTLLMSHAPNWSAYPPRERAIIGSTGKGKAGSYGDELTYVIPENNSKIGVVNYSDLWGGFGKYFGTNGGGGDGPLGQVNSALKDFFVEASNHISEHPDFKQFNSSTVGDSMENFKQTCDAITEYVNDMYKESLNSFLIELGWDDSYLATFAKVYKKHKDLYKTFLEVYDPKANKFKLVKPGDTLPQNREVWTDGKSLLIEVDKWKEMEDQIREIVK